VPTWRAEYFDRANGQSPERSVIIAAENEAVALEEVRAGIAPTCSRAEVTKLDPDLETGRLLSNALLLLSHVCPEAVSVFLKSTQIGFQ
jgi:hypothetical protein